MTEACVRTAIFGWRELLIFLTPITGAQRARADRSAFNDVVTLEELHFRKGQEKVKMQTTASLGRWEINIAA